MRFRVLIGALCAAVSLCAFGAIPASEQTTAVEFYNATLDHYFISADTKEISDLDTGVHAGWVRTGYKFAVIKAGSTYPGTSPVCRFYSPVPTIDSHFYSAKPSECDDVKTKFAATWQFESSEVFRAFIVDPNTGACPADTTATFRFYNKRADVNHRYSDQLSVFVYMTNKGYQPEGDGVPATPVAFCTVAGGDTVPVATAQAPNCTVTASTGTPAPGSTLALTATCTNNPTAFMWSGCASTTSSCNATKSTAGQASYTLNASNAQGPADPVTLSVNWGGAGGGGGATPICTISADNNQPANGTTLTLTANCSQAPSKYNWLECNYLVQSICNPIPACATSATTCKLTSSIPGYARYNVYGTNSAGDGAKAQGVDVYWTGGGGGGGGGGGTTNPPPSNDPIPSCALLVTNTKPTVGSNIVLTASCTGNPTIYYWDGVSCSQVQCQTTASAPGQITYSVSGANATGTGGVSYVTVDWQAAAGSGVPSCSLTPSNGSPQVGTQVTITANCTNSPTSYTWSGCSSTTSSCTATSSTTGVANYSLVATNASGNSPSASTQVNWQAVATGPPVCAIQASNTSPTVGQTITLSAVSCTGSPTSFVWTNCASNSSTCNVSASAVGNQTYYVAAVNQYGTQAVASGVTVSWQAATGGGGGGGGGGGSFCGSYPHVTQLGFGWGDPQWAAIHTADFANGFGGDAIYVVALTIPTTAGGYSTSGKTSIAEYGGPPTLREMTISTSACDFRNEDPTGAAGPLMYTGGVAATIGWNVGVAPLSLKPGTTYYFNFRNYNCNGSCEANIVTVFPH